MKPPYQFFDDLTPEEYESLKEDIGRRGILVPVEKDEHGNILDGHHRDRIAKELGIGYPSICRAGWTEQEKRSHARRLNILRRHLTQAQKRALIADQWRDTPGVSARTIAKALGVHHETAEAVRQELVSSGELAESANCVGPDEKRYPRERKPVSVLVRSHKEEERAQAALVSMPNIDTHSGKLFTPKEFEGYVPKDQKRKLNRHGNHETPPMPGDAKYNVILADPPWRYKAVMPQGAPEDHYPTMPVEDICALPVAGLAAEDCLLFLWATNPLLVEALQVVSAWGFTYCTNMVWVKNGLGLGFRVRGNHELLLIATKGKPPAPEPENRPASAQSADKSAHSRKPGIFHGIIERMHPDARRIELFCRRPRKGWDSWGNEVGGADAESE